MSWLYHSGVTGEEMASDERIKAPPWSVKSRCPICEDIRLKRLDLEGEQLFEDGAKKRPFFCPPPPDGCGHLDIRLHHEVSAVELGRTSGRGDAQPWSHTLVVRCASCEWKYVQSNQPCMSTWEEVMGNIPRPLDQTKAQKHAVAWSNEQAVGLRDFDEEYDPDAPLFTKTYKANRKLRITEAEAGEGDLTFKQTKKERKMSKRWKQSQERKKQRK
jgi:hypothetical protein